MENILKHTKHCYKTCNNTEQIRVFYMYINAQLYTVQYTIAVKAVSFIVVHYDIGLYKY
jgi:hypothetical protein